MESPVWRVGRFWAARVDGCADAFELWRSVEDGRLLVTLDDLPRLRALLAELETAGESEAWRVASMGGA